MIRRNKMTATEQNESQTNQVARRPVHRFQPGNPGGPGRPKKVLTAQELMDQQIRRDLKAVAKQHSPEAFRFLLETMRDTTAGVQHRLNAATQILDRGWGKPTNHTEVSVNVYDKLSDQELIKFITGEEIEIEAVEVQESSDDNSASEDS
jgi:hypothetical protein